MKSALFLLAGVLSLATCAAPAQSSLPDSAPVSPSIQHDGESTMLAYQVMMDMETLKPLSARFDMEFVPKKGSR